MCSAPADPITLSKHHGLGNDFLIAVDPPRPLTPADAAAWCDRRVGIGADGLIQATAEPGPSGRSADHREDAVGPARWRMVLFNSDGSRAEISGNGLRCLAQALADDVGHDRSSPLHLVVETDAGTREAMVAARPDSLDPDRRTDQVTVGMGKAVEGPAPSARWTELGVAVTAQVGVDLGNPHLVGFVDDLDGLDMAAIGPVVEADHPGGLNVHLVHVVDRARLEMIIWERGAGVTMACGSGACAAAWTAVRAGLIDPAGIPGHGIEVAMPGGSARVSVVDDEVTLTGPAVRVGEVRLDG